MIFSVAPLSGTLIRRLHEPLSCRVLLGKVVRGMIVVDAGAHWGAFTVLAAGRVGPTGRVYAFEPDAVNHRRLVRNTRNLKNVLAFGFALSDRDGEMTLHKDRYHGSHSLVGVRSPSSQTIVPTITLDRFVERHGLPGIDFLKIDIEGAELMAISGMESVLRLGRRPVILCEVHPPILPEDVAASLSRFQYRSALIDAEYSGHAHPVPVHLLAEPTSDRSDSGSAADPEN